MKEKARKRMSLQEIATATGTSYRTVAAYAHKAGWTQNGKKTLLDEQQVTIILEAMKKGHAGGPNNVAETLRTSLEGTETALSPALKLESRLSSLQMTTKELADKFGCDSRTIRNHASKLFPGKMRSGIKTLFDEREVTLILDSIKSVKSQNSTLKVDVQGTETVLTPILEVTKLTELIKQSYQRIDEIKTAEIARLNAELAGTRQLLAVRTTGLETIQLIAESGGLIMSDRDDIEATYRRR
jgi:DNA-binding CsgD family transcriptional regulator